MSDNVDMKDGLQAVWQYIANDILGNEDENPSYSGDEVGSIVYDYAETYLEGEEKEAWKAATHEQRNAWLDEAFPSDQHYGF